MDFRPLMPMFWAALGVAALVPALWWMQRRGWVDLSGTRVRKGTGHAMLGLQEFVQPSVDYVIQAENGEQIEDDDGESGAGGQTRIGAVAGGGAVDAGGRGRPDAMTQTRPRVAGVEITIAFDAESGDEHFPPYKGGIKGGPFGAISTASA